jgi:NAD(P)-dependent dehydrogenase (short-subunit alcohol dehydrogenase family)
MSTRFDPIDLSGKIAVVTGSSRGLGRAIAHELARHGAAVALVARNADQLRETERTILAEGGIARAISSDVSDAGSVLALKREIEDALGRPAILVNAAGIFGPHAARHR